MHARIARAKKRIGEYHDRRGAKARLGQIAPIVRQVLLHNSVSEHRRDRYSVNTTVSTTASHALVITANNAGDIRIGARTGDSMKMVSFSGRGFIQVADTYNMVRLTVYRWHVISTTAPTDADIYDDSSTSQGKLFGSLKDSSITTSAGIKRFSVIHDKLYKIDAGNPVRMVNFHQKWKNGAGITWDAGTANGVGLVFYSIVSDSSAVGHPAFQMYCQVRYNDS